MTPTELRALADAQPVAMLASHRRLIEQAIQSAEHPSGMSTHDGKARIDASILRRMLAIIDSLPAAPQAEPKRDWSTIDAAIREYLDDYELIGEDDAGADACYTPTERELYLIYDAINGLLADESFVAAISAPQAEPKREPLSDERIDELMERLFYHRRYEANRVTWEDVLAVVRATEHAHGIGGSDE